jgi:hypothetical protein
MEGIYLGLVCGRQGSPLNLVAVVEKPPE